MKLIKIDPKRPKLKKRATDGERGGQNDLAFEALRQARRCEQLAFRLEMLSDETKGEAKRQTYYQPNIDAIRKLRQHKGEHQWEHEGIKKLRQTKKVAEHLALMQKGWQEGTIKKCKNTWISGKRRTKSAKQTDTKQRENANGLYAGT